ncbi:hypothetical protein AgCh_017148 [Apium graveolens]
MCAWRYKDELVNEFGIQVGTEMTSIDARVLNPPKVPVRVAGGLLFELLGQSAGNPFVEEDDILVVMRSWQAQNFLVTALHVKGSASNINVLGVAEVQHDNTFKGGSKMVEGAVTKADKTEFADCLGTSWKTPYIMRLPLFAGIGGLLFGYDTGTTPLY